MRFTSEILTQILEEGRLAAVFGRSTAANPYIDDMNNERLDAWLEGYRAVQRPKK
ncbi:ribosome modulation factor [Neorhizobium sp. SOG26]|uniref:ribosome modulation factor n=1 Tax=Neorhizobium sp. SOG26 TaxID=2060726 RepID=UPI0040408F6F